MKTWKIYFLLLFLFTSCCPIIKPKGANVALFVEVRTSDNLSTDLKNCDGWIRIVNPAASGTNVSYSWSHDKHYTNYEASDLCPGLYKITVTENTYRRVTQVIIN